MNIDKARVNRFLMEIKRTGSDLNGLTRQNNLKPDSIELKAAKYMPVEMAGAICNQ